MLVAKSGRSADMTADVSCCCERTAVVPFRLEDHDVDLRQEEQNQSDRRRRTHRKAVDDRCTLHHTHTYTPSTDSVSSVITVLSSIHVLYTKTSRQRILMKGRIAGWRIVHRRGQCNMTLEHCGRLPQSANDVIDFCCVNCRSSDSQCFQWDGQPPKSPCLRGISTLM